MRAFWREFGDSGRCWREKCHEESPAVWKFIAEDGTHEHNYRSRSKVMPDFGGNLFKVIQLFVKLQAVKHFNFR